METNINNNIFNKLKKGFQEGMVAPSSETFFENYKKMNNFEKKRIEIMDIILNKNTYIKCILVLLIKKHTWKCELNQNFGVYGTDIDKFINLMSDAGFIIHKLLPEIDPIHMEAIISFNTISFYNQRTNIKILTLTNDGQEFVIRAMTMVKQLAINNQHIHFIINEVENKTKCYQRKVKEILGLESTQSTRIITYPCGLSEERRTLKYKQFEKDLKINLNSYKKESLIEKRNNNLITCRESEQLALSESNTDLVNYNENINKNIVNGYTYQGIYNMDEINSLLREPTKQELKEIEKNGTIGFIPNKDLQFDNAINKDYIVKGKGYHNQEQEIKKEEDIFSILGIDI